MPADPDRRQDPAHRSQHRLGDRVEQPDHPVEAEPGAAGNQLSRARAIRTTTYTSMR